MLAFRRLDVNSTLEENVFAPLRDRTGPPGAMARWRLARV